MYIFRIIIPQFKFEIDLYNNIIRISYAYIRNLTKDLPRK